MDKPIIWMGRSLKELRAMPDEVKDEIGYALDRVQKGETPDIATKMKGDLSDVMELHVDEGGDTYRTMYTVKLEGVVYVLDTFKKKAKRGRETPRADLERVRQRLKLARLDYRSLPEG
ncbi:MAG TPA: addiction module toxin RelE [Chloroflexi bacterium]|jgi:phage-related protein|nr:addiction module toxin RelE [Chloroflexota bacterium]